MDLCHGPHLPNTGLLKASAVSAVNRAHWRADVNNEALQVPFLTFSPACPTCSSLQEGLGLL